MVQIAHWMRGKDPNVDWKDWLGYIQGINRDRCRFQVAFAEGPAAERRQDGLGNENHDELMSATPEGHDMRQEQTSPPIRIRALHGHSPKDGLTFTTTSGMIPVTEKDFNVIYHGTALANFESNQRMKVLKRCGPTGKREDIFTVTCKEELGHEDNSTTSALEADSRMFPNRNPAVHKRFYKQHNHGCWVVLSVKDLLKVGITPYYIRETHVVVLQKNVPLDTCCSETIDSSVQTKVNENDGYERGTTRTAK